MKTPTEFAQDWSEESRLGFPEINDIKRASRMLRWFALHVLDEVEKRQTANRIAGDDDHSIFEIRKELNEK